MRTVGVETGGSNVQFAVHPDTGRLVVWFKDVNFLADTVTGSAEGTQQQVEALQELLGFERGNNRGTDPETRGPLGMQEFRAVLGVGGGIGLPVAGGDAARAVGDLVVVAERDGPRPHVERHAD